MTNQTEETLFRDFILRDVLRAESFGNGLSKELSSQLQSAKIIIQNKILNLKGNSFTKTYYKGALVEVNREIAIMEKDYESLIEFYRSNSANQSYNATTKKLLNKVGQSFKQSNFFIDRNRLNKLVKEPFGGRFLSTWMDSHLGNLKNRISESLVQGLLQNSTLPTIAKTIATDFDISKKGANFIARTALMDASNRGRVEVYKNNSDIIKSYMVVATLDSRTCPICGNLDGKIYKNIDDVPIFPIHALCRCAPVPLTRLDDPFEIERPAVVKEEFKTIKHRDGTTSKKRVSLKSESVRGNTNYKIFFDRQPDTWKKRYLGKSRYELYKQGKISYSDLSHNFQTRTIKNIEKGLKKKIKPKKIPSKLAKKPIQKDSWTTNSIKQEFGIQVSDQLGSKDSINKMGNELSRLNAEYPEFQAKDIPRKVGLKIGISNNTYLNVKNDKRVLGYYDHQNRLIALSRKSASLRDPVPLKPGGFKVSNGFLNDLRHEMGHAIMDNSRIGARFGFEDSVDSIFHYYSRKDSNFITESVSKYGSSNFSEFFAEAFAMYTHPDYGKKYSLPTELHKLFENMLGKRKKQ